MPSTREPDYVTIKLPLLHQPPSMGGNVTVGLEYQIKPTHIVRFLPNTRRAMRDGILDLDRFFPIDVLRSSPIDEIREACIFIFDFINGWATRGRRDFTDLFDDAILSISRARDQRRAAVEAALRLLSLCVVLHRANGLGCDGQLLDGVGRFADNLFNDWGAYLGIEHQAAVFSAFLGIYVSTSRELRWTMQSIWSKMDWWTRQRVVQRVFRMRNDSESAWEEWVLLMDLEYR